MRVDGELLVIKLGGTALASPRRVARAAARVAAHVRRGWRVVAVVSAAGRTTDTILRWAEAAAAGAAGREMDRALATGEDRSAALLALALLGRGVPARSLRGIEAGLLAAGEFGAASLNRLEAGPLEPLLAEGVVPVVSGFQAARPDGETVTLGRGGSDVTAVFLAAALGARRCDIVTDVHAVYDADPRLVPGAARLPRLSHDDLVRLALGGAQVVHAEAARLAWRHRVPLRIYHHAAPFAQPGGTHIDSLRRATARPSLVEDTVSIDGYRTTGTSPGDDDARPTLHLLGPGSVGRALLERIAGQRIRLIAVTDRSGTVHNPRGIDPRAVAALKAAGGRVLDLPGAAAVGIDEALDTVAAELVADATSTSFDRPEWADALDRAVVARGGGLALAAKDAVCRAAGRWFGNGAAPRAGINAVLGGTGRRFVDALPDLRARCRALAVAGNASTTTILQAIEAGGSLEDGLAVARARGFLEPDPELDLRGADAAVKLAIVAGAVLGRSIDLASIPCADLRSVDAALVRARAARGATTRLVGRLHADGRLEVGYEELPAGHPLAAPAGTVVYAYTLDSGDTHVHRGYGLGADGTAAALLDDILALAATAEPDLQLAGAPAGAVR